MIAQQAIGSIFNVHLGGVSVKIDKVVLYLVITDYWNLPRFTELQLQILVILVFLKTKIHEAFLKAFFSTFHVIW